MGLIKNFILAMVEKFIKKDDLYFLLDSLWSGLVALIYDATFGFLKDTDEELCDNTYKNWLSVEKRQFSESSCFSGSDTNDIVFVLETFAISFVDLTPEKGQELCTLQVHMSDILAMDDPIERIYKNTKNKEIHEYLLSKKQTLVDLIGQRQ